LEETVRNFPVIDRKHPFLVCHDDSKRFQDVPC
jgi:hypothetical protein